MKRNKIGLRTFRTQLPEEWILSTLECTAVKGSISKNDTYLEIINESKIITNVNFPSFTEAFEHELLFHQTYNIKRWLTTVTSHTLPVYMKTFHF